MASLRNAVKRKTHKERSQPISRKKFGLLEKKSDYKLRARDYRRKKGRLRVLNEKAQYRNPDEFYFSMVKKKTIHGIHQGGMPSNREYDTEPISKDIKKLLHSQDVAYVQTKLNQETRKIEKLNNSLHFLGSSGSSNSKHTIFVDKIEGVDVFSATKYFNTVECLKNRAYNRPSKETLSNAPIQESTFSANINNDNLRDGSHGKEKASIKSKRQMKKLKKKRKRAYQELNARIEREEKLQATVKHLELRKHLNGVGRRRKVKGGNGDQPAVYKWKRERKR